MYVHTYMYVYVRASNRIIFFCKFDHYYLTIKRMNFIISFFFLFEHFRGALHKTCRGNDGRIGLVFGSVGNYSDSSVRVRYGLP